VAKIFGTVYGVEPCKLFSWWKASFIHAEESNLEWLSKWSPASQNLGARLSKTFF
jgi:hypothetical protein